MQKPKLKTTTQILKLTKLLCLVFVLFIYLYPIPYTLYPIHAQGVDIGKYFGFGRVFSTDSAGNTSLGVITSKLVTPIFSIAVFVVTWYFLWGAWEWIISEGDKQRVADARNKITQGIVGFLILIVIFFILPFILYKLFNVDLKVFSIIKF